MEVDFYLPLEIILNILSRLPIKTILRCKCVCKPWLDLIESPEFSELHRSKSIVSLVVYQDKWSSNSYKILQIVDEPLSKNGWRYYNLLFAFEVPYHAFPYHAYAHSSVNGLLLMYERQTWLPDNLYICNPITREYIKFPLPEHQTFHVQTFGFGVSKMTGKYKLVKINTFHSEYFSFSECKIYTLGTRSWRSIKPDNHLKYEGFGDAFLNGNLHWPALDLNHGPLISCFDLETEIFSRFSSPPGSQLNPMFSCVSALLDRLCVCDYVDGEIFIWLMKEYGDERSWTKEYSIKIGSNIEMWGLHYSVEISEDGVILIEEKDGLGLVCYTIKAGAYIVSFPPINRSQSYLGCAVFYTPSFLSLEMFDMENVSSF